MGVIPKKHSNEWQTIYHLSYPEGDSEGLRGVEVIADDFVVVSYGESWQSAIKDHDRNLLSFLQRCDECGVHLNSDKLQLRMKKVPFIGNVATSEGLHPYPS